MPVIVEVTAQIINTRIIEKNIIEKTNKMLKIKIKWCVNDSI